MNPKTASLEIDHPAPPLRYLPEDFAPLDFAAIEPWLVELEQRPLGSVEELERWVMDRSELESLISEESVSRMYASVCKTDDEALEKAHLDFQTVVLPAMKPVDDRLDHKYLNCSFRQHLPSSDWEVFDRDTELGVHLFREANVPLEAEEEKKSNRYQRIIGAMTVEFRGETKTLSAMGTFFEDPDREIREEAWRLTSARRLEDQENLEILFEELLELRQQQAKNADFDNYRDYMHEAKGRFDYTPQDCLAFQDNVARYVMPLAEKMADRRRTLLQLPDLRPWDMAVDPDASKAFQPFQDQAGQVDVSSRLMGEVRGSFGAELAWMHDQGLLDLETRPHKAPGGFMDNLERRRVPVIFANSGTTHSDVETLIHEGGHALNGLLCRELEPMPYRMPPLEFAEVASMGMEAMCMEHYSAVYSPEDTRSSRIKALEGIVQTFPWVAAIDGFQQWVYTHEGHDRAARQAAWVDLQSRFSAGASWQGLEAEQAALWQKQLHVYEVPFYYIEYALAQMGACQLWVRYRKDKEETVDRYVEGLQLGGSRKLPELFTAAGLEFDPRGDHLGVLMTEIEAAWHAEISK